MKSQTPIVKGFEDQEVVYAKDQPEYSPLPALIVDNGMRIITRWRLSWTERLRVLFCGDIFLWVMTFGHALQPVYLSTKSPDVDRDMQQSDLRDKDSAETNKQ